MPSQTQNARKEALKTHKICAILISFVERNVAVSQKKGSTRNWIEFFYDKVEDRVKKGAKFELRSPGWSLPLRVKNFKQFFQSFSFSNLWFFDCKNCLKFLYKMSSLWSFPCVKLQTNFLHFTFPKFEWRLMLLISIRQQNDLVNCYSPASKKRWKKLRNLIPRRIPVGWERSQDAWILLQLSRGFDYSGVLIR